MNTEFCKIDDTLAILRPFLIGLALCLSLGQSLEAQSSRRCDPSKVVTFEACAKCHEAAISTWKQTPHFQTFQMLHRTPRAKEICSNLGLKGSIKRNDVCINCHYTTQKQGERLRAVSGVSCESCHGAAREWVKVHSDYGGPNVSHETETAEHRTERFSKSIKAGMRNPRNMYSLARSCLECHTVPNEKLVNVGKHRSASDFELVSWSQGSVRHNFVRTRDGQNAQQSRDGLRVLYVVGLIADLEFSTRATAKATSKSNFGITVAKRAADKALKLYEIQQEINNPQLQVVLESFALAKLKANNADQLNRIADQIMAAGFKFAESADGSKMAALDKRIPPPSQYR